MRKQDDQKNLYYEALRIAIWKRAIGDSPIGRANHYYERIKEGIKEETGYVISKDTIKNFLEEKHLPQPKPLDIYCTYVLGGNSEYPKTFQDFQNWYHNQSTFHKIKALLIRNKKGFNVVIGGLFVIIILISLVLYRQTPSPPFEISKAQKTIPYFKKFVNSDLGELRESDWFLFPDSIDLNLWNNPKYEESGYLTLETHLGGPFLDNKDYDPLTINIPSHSIKCGSCCEIYVKLVDFVPYQRYQQAGFFIFYNDTPVPSISYTFAGVADTIHRGGTNHIQAVKRDGEYSNHHLIRGSKRSLVSSIKDGVVENPVDSLVFKMIIENHEYSFLYKTDTNSYIPVRTENIYFPEPKYIGLTAFQGRPEIPYPIYPVADTIPAHFEYVRIDPCEE